MCGRQPHTSMHIDGSTRIVGVFGAPITHTASPAMHNAAFEALGMNWVYVPFHVEAANLRSALTGMRDMGMAGINLTVPHKVPAVGLVDNIDSEARHIGALNTIVVEDGKLRGFNTDAHGFAAALQEEFNLSLQGLRVVVLGAGGAARAIAVKCALEGATEIVIANRTVSNTEPIVREIAPRLTKCRGIGLDRPALARVIAGAKLVVNATSVGLRDGDALRLDASMFSSDQYVFDVVYRPAETELLRAAAQAGAQTANGLGMLLHQGAKAFEIWTKQKAPLAVMRRALQAAIGGDA